MDKHDCIPPSPARNMADSPKNQYFDDDNEAEAGTGHDVGWTVERIISNRSPVPIPHKLILNVSDQCNFSCRMCAFRSGNRELRMTPEDWKKLISETYRSGATYTFFGGEPLLYEDIDGLIQHTGSLEAPMTIATNGYYLTKHLESLLENRCQITLSIDGMRETHDTIRGCQGSFERIEAALAQAARQYPDAFRKLICVNSVLLPENAKETGRLIDYLYGIGISVITFQHLQFYGKRERESTNRLWRDYMGQGFTTSLQPRKPYGFDEDALHRLQASVDEILGKRELYPDMAICVYPDLLPEELPLYYSEEHCKLGGKSMCVNPWTSATVSSDGTISLCLDARIGNYKEQGFWSAWYGQEAQNFRDFVFRRRFPVCTRCCNFYNSYIPE